MTTSSCSLELLAINEILRFSRSTLVNPPRSLVASPPSLVAVIESPRPWPSRYLPFRCLRVYGQRLPAVSNDAPHQALLMEKMMAEKAADKDAGKGDKEDPNAKKSSVVRVL